MHKVRSLCLCLAEFEWLIETSIWMSIVDPNHLNKMMIERYRSQLSTKKNLYKFKLSTEDYKEFNRQVTSFCLYLVKSNGSLH